MSIGRTFKESLQKCLRSLEIGRSGLGGDGKPWRLGTEVYGDRDILPRDVISRKLTVPNAERVFFIRHALRAGFTVEEIFQLTKIDRWFLTQIKEIVDFEEELAGTKALPDGARVSAREDSSPAALSRHAGDCRR
jgi:carbamoyl-phosphate synthase large subunit